jgi:hypothetical protein
MLKKVLTILSALAMIVVFASCKQDVFASDGDAFYSTYGNATYGNATYGNGAYVSYGNAVVSDGNAATPDDAVGLPNPVVDVTGSEELALILGFSISVPEDTEDVHYGIISDTIAQIQFAYADREYTYRAAKTVDDFSGVYEMFDPETDSIELDAGDFIAEITISYIDSGYGGALARWYYVDTQYTLYTPDPSDYDSMTDAVLPLVYADLPFPACVG